jgi:alpha-ketoglutarate-dependent taurine dioxygenase
MLATRALHPLFGVEILGVDVKRVDDGTFKEIVDLFNDHSVLLFRGQTLTDAEQIDFSQRFGPLETTIRSIVSQAIARLSNSRLPHISQIQAGKWGTIINSSPSQEK